MRKRSTLLAAALAFAVFLTTNSTRAQDAFQRGVEAFELGDYEEAVRYWEPYATEGDADAMFNLGYANLLMHRDSRDIDSKREFREKGWMWMELGRRFGSTEAREAIDIAYGGSFPELFRDDILQRVNHWLAAFCANQSPHEAC
jgi:TPR repeat protein